MEISGININKSFRKKVVLKDLNFNYHKGVNIVAGNNGAGKSTLFYIIDGILKPDDGKVFFNNVDTYKQHSLISKHISFMSEQSSFIGSITIKEYIYWFSSLTGSKIEEIKNYLSFFKIDYVMDSYSRSLSSGESKLVNLSCYLSMNSEIYILDEPNSNVDINKRSLISTAIAKKSKNENSIFIISTHIFDELLAINSQISILNNGKIYNIDAKRQNDYVILLKTNNNNLLLNELKKTDQNAFASNNGIYTKLSFLQCAEICNKYNIKIISSYSIPSGMEVLYE